MNLIISLQVWAKMPSKRFKRWLQPLTVTINLAKLFFKQKATLSLNNFLSRL